MELVLVGFLCGVVGSFVVLRGMAFIGDALAHAVFPGVVIAFLLNKSFFAGGLVFGLLTTLLIAIVSRNRRISEDTAIGILFAGMFALGVVFFDQQLRRLHAGPFIVPHRQRAGDFGQRPGPDCDRGSHRPEPRRPLLQGAPARLIRPELGDGARLPNVRDRLAVALIDHRDDCGFSAGGG